MSAGRMRDLLRLRIPVVTDDGEGGQAIVWTNGPDIWGDLQDISAREQAISGAVQTIATHRIATYFDVRITGTCRFARVTGPAGPELQILGVRDPDGRQRWMDVDCAEVV